MNEPTETSFSEKLSGPPFLRIGIVIGAFLVLVISAALTMAASPEPSSGTFPAPAAGAPAAGDQNPMGALGPGSGSGLGMPDFRGPGFGFGSHGFGGITITAINDSDLSLKTADGWTRTITVTGSTKISKGGQTAALGDLKVDDQIQFRQTGNSNGTYSIDAIAVILPQVAGDVTAKGSDSITVKDRAGATTTIHVSSATTYKVPGVTSASLSDIAVGMHVIAEGTQASDGSISASVVLGFSDGQPGWGRGRMHEWGGRVSPGNPAPSASPTGTTGGA